jgi:putative CocE/NonD family hydrolase
VSLILGPWLQGYDDFSRTWSGDVDFGSESTFDVNDERRRWFDTFVNGLDTGVREEPPIRLFVMGGGGGRRTLEGRLDHGGRWRTEHEWPLARTEWTPFYLQADGILSREPPPATVPPSQFVFDPADPVPTIGGGTQTSLLSGFIQGGGFDQRGRPGLWACRDTHPLAERPDVLVFVTPPLAADVEVTGPIVVRLWVATSAVDTDFTAKLIDVYPASDDYPDGYALNLTDGIRRMRYRQSWTQPETVVPGEIYELTIEPQATSNRFQRGHRIRLDISSSNFPRFDVNPNTGEPPGSRQQPVAARQMLFHDAARPSHLVLPLIPSV